MDPINDFTDIMKIIASNENVECPRWEFKYEGKKNEGNMSLRKTFDLIGNNKTLNLIVKFASPNVKVRETMNTAIVFQQEINFYEEVVTSLNKFQAEYKIKNPFDNTAKCYLTMREPPKELLVLEDLKSSGFHLWDRSSYMNRPHLELVMKTFAKFHATSMALKALKPLEYARLRRILTGNRPKDLFDELTEKTDFYRHFLSMAAPLIGIFDETNETVYCNKFRKFAETIDGHLREGLNVEQTEDEVFSQGDCWTNNMMFRYGSVGLEPVDMKVIDFQLVSCRPATLDLSYFFYSSASLAEIGNLDHYLKVYHVAFKEHLAKFGGNLDDLFSLDKLKRSWTQCSKHGFIWSLYFRKEMLENGRGDIPDLEKCLESDKTLAESLVSSNSLIPSAAYQRDIKELVKHFIDCGFMG